MKENIFRGKKVENLLTHITGDNDPRISVNNFKLNEMLNVKMQGNSLLGPLKKIPLNVKREHRPSKMDIISNKKQFLMGKLGTKYNLMFSFSKRFVLNYDANKLREELNSGSNWVMENFCQFTRMDLHPVIKEDYIKQLVELTMLEMRFGQ